MNLLILVNDVRRISPSSTTRAFITASVARGWQVWLTSPDRLWLNVDDVVYADVVSAKEPSQPSTQTPVAAMDLVWIRTNPGRDRRTEIHDTALTLLTWAQEAGVRVINDPSSLRWAGSKLYLSRIPSHCRPETLVSRSPEALLNYVRSRDTRTVLKPLRGTQGADVFIVNPGKETNLRAIVDVLVRKGHVVAQDWIPEGVQGDIRIILLNGEVLTVNGRPAAVARIPASGELRSNVHLGGHPTSAKLTQVHHDIVAAVGPVLRKDGLFLVGLDVVGPKVVEINVFSTGGLPDAGLFEGVDYVAAVLDALPRP